MNLSNFFRLVVACVTACLLVACERDALTPESDANAIAMDADDIAGVVRSDAGIEAGVWVIAETEELGTRFMRIVVTDDAGNSMVRIAAQQLQGLPDSGFYARTVFRKHQENNSFSTVPAGSPSLP